MKKMQKTYSQRSGHYVSFRKVKAKALKNHRIRKEYDALEPEFKFIRAVLKARGQRGLTQAQLARRSGTTQSAIARFESGAGNPTIGFLSKVSEALGKELVVHLR